MAAATAVLLAVALVTASADAAGSPDGRAKRGANRPLPERPLFLDVFRVPDPAIVTKRVEWPSAIGDQRGWLVQAHSDERLPGLLLIADSQTDDFFIQSARELASIGYQALVVSTEPDRVGAPAATPPSKQSDALRGERMFAQLGSAVRWMRRRGDVCPDKLGILGWGKQARWALELAAGQSLQAVVVTDGELPLAFDASRSIGLRQTAVLVVCGTSGAKPLDRERVATFERALAVAGIEHRVLRFKEAKNGFLERRRRDPAEAKSADHAWFQIYEFLGKHVEDAAFKPPPTPTLTPNANSKFGPPDRPFVTIGDVMRAVNGPLGLRGEISRSLDKTLRGEKDWKLLKARAALMADSGVLLMREEPPKGTRASWLCHAASYRSAAAELAAAAERRDQSEARRAFDRLNASCARCHADHR